MPASQLRASPQRATARSHSGIDSAAHKKYVPRNSGSCAGVARSRSWMKNSTSVAGTALAIPLTMNTASRRRNAVLCQGCHRLAGGCGAGEVVGAVAVAGAALGAGARVQASQPSASAALNTASITGSPASAGSTEASTTPTSAQPSRQATVRLRCSSLPPSRAPQDWWAMPSKL